jgi:LmbE family N-acetylglucosaminyl deacetylase
VIGQKMHLFLSPHADDAVFSCGGYITQLTRRGEVVTIYTVMAGHPPADFRPTPFSEALHQRWRLEGTAKQVVDYRRDEDAAAAWAVGARIEFGPHLEAIYRVRPADGQALYTGKEAIFGAVHPDEPLTIPALEAALETMLAGPITALYAPLGAGGHVDHQLTRDLALALAHRFPALLVYFYEDYPYAGDGQNIVQAALQAFGQPLLRVVHAIDAEALATKIRASACYRSQISTFWADEAVLADELHAYDRLIGGEGFWRLLRAEADQAIQE